MILCPNNPYLMQPLTDCTRQNTPAITIALEIVLYSYYCVSSVIVDAGQRATAGGLDSRSPAGGHNPLHGHNPLRQNPL